MPEEKNNTEAQKPAEPHPRRLLRDKPHRAGGRRAQAGQGYVIAGLAVLILLAVMFSKNHAKPAPKKPSASGVCCFHGRQPAQDSRSWSRT